MIRNLVFDYGKVLVNYDFARLFRDLIPDEGKRQAFAEFINDPARVEVFDLGFKNFEGVVEDFISERPDFEQELRLFAAHKTEAIFEQVPGMYELLSQLKSEGFRLYGLTNWDTLIYDTLEQFEIFRLLDGMVISSEVHTVKPHPQIYGILFDKYGLVPQECVFADDKAENVLGGRALGMEGIVFRNARQYEDELRALLESR